MTIKAINVNFAAISDAVRGVAADVKHAAVPTYNAAKEATGVAVVYGAEKSAIAADAIAATTAKWADQCNSTASTIAERLIARRNARIALSK